MIARMFGRLLLTALCVLVAYGVVAASSQAGLPPGAKVSRDTVTVSHVKPLDEIPYRFLAKVADRAIRKGHVYSSRWGDASPWLRSLVKEMVDRRFSEFGTERWALYVVHRESGFNPGAINSRSGANGIAQMMPHVHTGYDHYRIRHDMRYALATFLRLSRNGRNTGPWCLC